MVLWELTWCRGYTVAGDGEVSFRVQVALRATVLDVEGLQAVVEGRDDGEEQQDLVDGMIKKILGRKVASATHALSVLEGDDEVTLLARKLWASDLYIARLALNNYSQ